LLTTVSASAQMTAGRVEARPVRVVEGVVLVGGATVAEVGVVGVPALMGVAYARPVRLALVQGQEQSREEQEREREEERRQREEERKQREEERKERERERLERQDELYDDGQEALDEGKWEQALKRFEQVANARGKRADGALYWKAYAENKLGRPAQAIETLQTLAKEYPQSRWLKDAKALEVEVRQSTGQKPDPTKESDCELKLLAVNALMNRNSEEAVPILEKLLVNPGDCPKLRARALFVLAQSNSPRAREVMARIARGDGNPDMQKRAIQYLGIHGGRENKQLLSELYATATDLDVKRSILRSFMVSGEKTRLFEAAKNEKTPELRGDAIHWLGVMGAHDELWQLYQAESSIELKKRILHSFGIGGGVDRLLEVARSDASPELRMQAIHGLGISGGAKSAEGLKNLYAGEKDPNVRKKVLHALFIQGNDKALIEVARKETDPALKKQAVHWISLMGTKEATDFMMEILNK
jgi:HEAT repeat protein